MDVSLRYRAPRQSCSSALYSGGSALCSPLPGPEGSPEQAGFWSAVGRCVQKVAARTGPLTMLYDPEEAPADSRHRGQHGGAH